MADGESRVRILKLLVIMIGRDRKTYNAEQSVRHFSRTEQDVDNRASKMIWTGSAIWKLVDFWTTFARGSISFLIRASKSGSLQIWSNIQQEASSNSA